MFSSIYGQVLKPPTPDIHVLEPTSYPDVVKVDDKIQLKLQISYEFQDKDSAAVQLPKDLNDKFPPLKCKVESNLFNIRTNIILTPDHPAAIGKLCSISFFLVAWFIINVYRSLKYGTVV